MDFLKQWKGPGRDALLVQFKAIEAGCVFGALGSGVWQRLRNPASSRFIPWFHPTTANGALVGAVCVGTLTMLAAKVLVSKGQTSFSQIESRFESFFVQLAPGGRISHTPSSIPPRWYLMAGAFLGTHLLRNRVGGYLQAVAIITATVTAGAFLGSSGLNLLLPERSRGSWSLEK